MPSFDEILGNVGNAVLGAVLGIDESHVRTMKARGSIPPEYWPALVAKAEEVGQPGLTIDRLLEMRRAKAALKKSERAA